MLLWLAGSCTLIFDDEIADKLGTQSSDCEPAPFWFDNDGDGFGDAAIALEACELPVGYADNRNDCADEAVGVNPDAAEVCDGLDNDCQGGVDKAAVDAPIWYQDLDGDNFGNDSVAMASCLEPEEYVATGGDCDDSDSSITTGETYFRDGDGDGWGTAAVVACELPTGAVPVDGDCDDTVGTISPGGTETCDDGTDQDCDGADLACPPVGDYTTAWGSEMVAISAGSCTMGGGAGDPDGVYRDHVVTLTHDFWIGETEITRGQWESLSENSAWRYESMPGFPCTTATSTDDCPADTVSWYEVAKYCNALSAQEGLAACYLANGTDLAAAYVTDPYACPGYRMPTEAEWEYAARAGQDTEFSGSNSAVAVAWYIGNAYYVGTYSHQVATLAPNAWGLYDMSGNVWEWTNDWYSESYGGYGNGAAQTDPVGPTSGSNRVVRGGNWSGGANNVRVTYRYDDDPDRGVNFIGVRLARSNP